MMRELRGVYINRVRVNGFLRDRMVNILRRWGYLRYKIYIFLWHLRETRILT